MAPITANTKWIDAKFWQNMVMALICLSFIYANARHGAAYDLWHDSPEAMILFLTTGVGLEMGKDVAEQMVNRRLSAGSAKIDNPDRGI